MQFGILTLKETTEITIDARYYIERREGVRRFIHSCVGIMYDNEFNGRYVRFRDCSYYRCFDFKGVQANPYIDIIPVQFNVEFYRFYELDSQKQNIQRNMEHRALLQILRGLIGEEFMW